MGRPACQSPKSAAWPAASICHRLHRRTTFHRCQAVPTLPAIKVGMPIFGPETVAGRYPAALALHASPSRLPRCAKSVNRGCKLRSRISICVSSSMRFCRISRTRDVHRATAAMVRSRTIQTCYSISDTMLSFGRVASRIMKAMLGHYVFFCCKRGLPIAFIGTMRKRFRIVVLSHACRCAARARCRLSTTSTLLRPMGPHRAFRHTSAWGV